GVLSLQNPTLIVEVLSNSTEQADRGEKMRCYQTLGSLQTYVLVAQDRPSIEVYERRPDESWNLRRYEGLDTVIPLPAIGCQLRPAGVYPPEEPDDVSAEA